MTISSVQSIWAHITDNIAFLMLIPISHCIPSCYILILSWLRLQAEARRSAIELFQHVVTHCNANNDDFFRASNMSPYYRQHCIPKNDADLPLHPKLLYSYSILIETPSNSPEISPWVVLTCCSTLEHKYWRYSPCKQYEPKLIITNFPNLLGPRISSRCNFTDSIWWAFSRSPFPLCFN